MAHVEITEYKGNPIITIKNDPYDRYPFSFGVKKAKMVIEHLEDIKKFIAEHDKEEPKKEAKEE